MAQPFLAVAVDLMLQAVHVAAGKNMTDSLERALRRSQTAHRDVESLICMLAEGKFA